MRLSLDSGRDKIRCVNVPPGTNNKLMKVKSLVSIRMSGVLFCRMPDSIVYQVLAEEKVRAGLKQTEQLGKRRR